jgi:hypothetical protein
MKKKFMRKKLITTLTHILFALIDKIMTEGIIMSSILLVIAIIGLIGVINENKWIVISTTAFSAIGVIAQFLTGNISLAIPSLAITVLIGVYAFMIVKTDTETYYFGFEQSFFILIHFYQKY